MNTHIETLKNIQTQIELTSWAENLSKSSKYHKNIMTRRFMVSQCNYPTWIAVSVNDSVCYVVYHCNDSLSSSLYHIFCDYCAGKTKEEILSIQLNDFKLILEYFDNQRKQDIQRVINRVKKYLMSS